MSEDRLNTSQEWRRRVGNAVGPIAATAMVLALIFSKRQPIEVWSSKESAPPPAQALETVEEDTKVSPSSESKQDYEELLRLLNAQMKNQDPPSVMNYDGFRTLAPSNQLQQALFKLIDDDGPLTPNVSSEQFMHSARNILQNSEVSSSLIEFMNSAVDYHVARDTSLTEQEKNRKKLALLKEISENPSVFRSIQNEYKNSSDEAEKLSKEVDRYLETQKQSSRPPKR